MLCSVMGLYQREIFLQGAASRKCLILDRQIRVALPLEICCEEVHVVSETPGVKRGSPCTTFICVYVHVFLCKTKRALTKIERECKCVCACIKKTREMPLRQPAHLLSHL